MNWLLVFLGGGVGSLLRYGLALSFPVVKVSEGQLPWHTLAANLAACILLGIGVALIGREVLPKQAALLLVTGLCGGFSTFSTFSDELLALTAGGHWGSAALYLFLSLFGGVLGIWVMLHLLR